MRFLAKATLWLLKRLLSLTMPVALAFLAFMVGALIMAFELPPHQEIRKLIIAGVSVMRWAQLEQAESDEDHPHIIVSDAGGGKAMGRLDPDRANGGVTMAQAFANDRFAMLLLGGDGTQLHRWDVPDEVYQKIEAQGWKIDRGFQEIMGGHMYQTGDVLGIIYQKGLFRIDRCSRLKWFQPGLYHHDATVAADGSIWALSANYRSEQPGAYPHIGAPHYDDVVVRLSPEGEVLEEISLLDAIYRSGYQGLVLGGKSAYPESKQDDPAHSNDIEIVGKEFAARHDFAETGDLLVSLRAADSIVLIDRATKLVKWALTGMFLRQHDPDLQPDGSITIFDNRTDRGQFNKAERTVEPQSFGYSRLLRFDPASQRVLWEFQGSREEPFYTSVQGDHQVLPNGNVMAVETEAGRIIEIDPKTNEIVWEWFNVVTRGARKDLVGRVTRAFRYDSDYAAFIGKDCPAAGG
jgi:hypothetical protein